MATWTIYDHFRQRSFNASAGNLDAGGDGVKVALITSALAPSQANDVTWNAPGYTEVTGTNYVAGGLSIDPGMSITLAGGVMTWKTTTTVSWAQSNTGFNNARYAVIYDVAKGTLIMFGDFGGTVGNTLGALTISGPSAALFTSP